MTALVDGEDPCLVCPQAFVEATKAGCTDLAFLIPQLALCVWQGGALSSSERALVNNALAHLIRHLNESAAERAVLADGVREAALGVANKDPKLTELVSDFLVLFVERRGQEVTVLPNDATRP